MALPWHTALLLLFLSLVVVHSLHFNLIHKYSVHSPLFPGNLTEENKAQLLYEGDMARARLLRSSLFGLNYSVEHLRPNLKSELHHYAIELFIGTPARRKYYLLFDTASAFLWLQCKPCIHCWKQDTQIFHPAKESSSFDPIPCNHTLCDLREPGWKCVKGKCHYSVAYVGGYSSRGILASETFGFASEGSSTQRESVRNIVFGCGDDNQGFRPHEEFSGIFGLNMQPWSLVNQLTGLIGGRFSYCLSPIVSSKQPPSRLKFGNEAVLRGPRVKIIHIVRLPTSMGYPLPLSDVSIAGRRLGFKPADFAVRKRADGSVEGGFIIDSGSTYTTFSTGGPYERITEAFKAYFRPFSTLQPTKHSHFDVCYILPRERLTVRLPSMGFHFGDHAKYIVQPKYTMVKFERNIICVAIKGYSGLNLLGLQHQYDYHFSFNVMEMLLSFGPADCSKVV